MKLDSRTELVIAVDIARRLGISPQRVNVLANVETCCLDPCLT